MPPTPPLVLLGCFVVGWLLATAAAGFAVGRLSGWRVIAERHPARGPRPSGVYRWATQVGVGPWLRVQVSAVAHADGLRLTPLPHLRPGVRPVDLPWSELQVVGPGGLRTVADARPVRLRVGDGPTVDVPPELLSVGPDGRVGPPGP